MALRQFDRAEQYLSAALNTRVRVLGTDHPDIYRTRTELALLLNLSGRYASAESLGKMALVSEEKVLGPDSPDIASTLTTIATSLEKQGKDGEAERVLRRALDVEQKSLGEESGEVIQTRDRLIAVLQSQGKFAEARQLLGEGSKATFEIMGPGEKSAGFYQGSAEGFYDRGLHAMQKGRVAEAREHLQTFLKLAPRNPRASEVRRILAGLRDP